MAVVSPEDAIVDGDPQSGVHQVGNYIGGGHSWSPSPCNLYIQRCSGAESCAKEKNFHSNYK